MCVCVWRVCVLLLLLLAANSQILLLLSLLLPPLLLQIAHMNEVLRVASGGTGDDDLDEPGDGGGLMMMSSPHLSSPSTSSTKAKAKGSSSSTSTSTALETGFVQAGAEGGHGNNMATTAMGSHDAQKSCTASWRDGFVRAGKSALVSIKEHWRIFKIVPELFVSLLVTYTCTLSMFPGVLAHVPPALGEGDWFIPIWIFVCQCLPYPYLSVLSIYRSIYLSIAS